MTTLIDRGVDGPRTHALVIGVGRYPYCDPANGAATRGPWGALARRFTAVSSPPCSAVAVAQWLMDEQGDDAIAPLGSVELFVSGNVPSAVGTPDGPVVVEPPTFAAVEAGFRRWYQRCDAHDDNVAFFFFSGHGCARGSQLLLLEDVGASELNFFGNAIAIDTTVQGMARCRARAQCYFIDACREIPDELLAMADIAARPLIQPLLHRGFRDAPVIFSTTPGDRAFGVDGGPTLFTGAVLQALGGLAARQPRPGRWEVTTDLLAPTIDRLLTWREGCGQRAVGEGSVQGRAVRRLRREPQVAFRLGCAPREALPAAELRLVRPLSERLELRRLPALGLWEDRARADYYELRALFGRGEFGDTAEGLVLYPPHVEFDLPVLRRVDLPEGHRADAHH